MPSSESRENIPHSNSSSQDYYMTTPENIHPDAGESHGMTMADEDNETVYVISSDAQVPVQTSTHAYILQVDSLFNF